MASAKASLDRPIPLKELVVRKMAAHSAHTDNATESVAQISSALTVLPTNIFALYVKTKNFHWQRSAPHFRDYHLLLDERGDRLFAMTDESGQRVRKIGGTTLRSIGYITRIKRVDDNRSDNVTPLNMLSESWKDNEALLRCIQCSWNCAFRKYPHTLFRRFESFGFQMAATVRYRNCDLGDAR
jgi:starvation-inducible DNA-binding protein